MEQRAAEIGSYLPDKVDAVEIVRDVGGFVKHYWIGVKPATSHLLGGRP